MTTDKSNKRQLSFYFFIASLVIMGISLVIRAWPVLLVSILLVSISGAFYWKDLRSARLEKFSEYRRQQRELEEKLQRLILEEKQKNKKLPPDHGDE